MRYTHLAVVRQPSRAFMMRVALLCMLTISTFVPFAILVLQSFSAGWRWPDILPTAYTTAGWSALAESTLGGAAVTSVLLALATALTATVFGVPVGRALARLSGSRRHIAAGLVFLPVAAPPIALGAGLQVGTLWLGLGGTAAGVWLAHCVPAIGYVSLLMLGVFTTREASDEEAARTHGASAWQTWRLVILPTLRTPVTEAIAIAFLISWAQVALTLVVGGGAVRALPIEVLSLVRAGQERDAAVGAILLVLPAVLALAALRTGSRRTDALPT